MIFNKKLATAVSGAVLLMAGQFALADSTSDIVDALVSKGVLTEEEGKLISKGHAGEKKAQDKAIKGKLSISSALESATLYGDARIRFEDRQATGEVGAAKQGTAIMDRFRGKFLFGMTMNNGSWYSDFALSTGGKGRSDNFNMGSYVSGSGIASGKNAGDQAIGVNKLMVGWNATDWLTLEAGRMKNPLYTTQMVWDADLPVEGLTEKFKYKLNAETELFANVSQIAYLAAGSTPNIYFNNQTTPNTTNNTIQLFAEQVGAKYNFNDKTSGKAAFTYYSYNHGNSNKGGGIGVFQPTAAGSAYSASAQQGVNNLSIIEIPAEINYMAWSDIGLRLYGDYAINTTASGRANDACTVGAAAACGDEGNDTAWLLGLAVGSASDFKAFESNKMKKGDWLARIWYQDVGIWALDPNTVDSDFMDGRLNTKGVVAKGQYNIEDNVLFNVSAGYGVLSDRRYTSAGYGDMGFNFSHLSLIQTDLTWKF